MQMTKAQGREVEICEMYRACMTGTAIAKEVGLDRNTIYAILRRHAVQVRAAGATMRDIDWERMAEDYLRKDEEGKYESIYTLCARYGISTEYMYAMFRKIGVQTRTEVDSVNIARTERLQAAVLMYQKGAKLKDIKVETGIDQSTLYTILARLGIPNRGPRYWSSPLWTRPSESKVEEPKTGD